jgi:uracil-DNA glycosylase
MKTSLPRRSRDPTWNTSAAEYLPSHLSIKSLRRSAAHCRGCELYRRAIQTVFGQGFVHSKLMLLGEVPGDQEDRLGIPFIGPAGKLLDESLQAAGTDRKSVYLTNTVKHFKWQPRGKLRLHKKPTMREIRACRPWLEAEIELVRPHTIVCLGATAAQALLGNGFRLTRHLGELLSSPWAKYIVATYHPASALRAPRKSDRQRIREQLIHDLKLSVESTK